MPRDSETRGFPREVRLRHRRQFQILWSKGRRFHTPHFIVLVMVPPDPQSARLGLTVSRKVGGAVVRNRVKRGVREVFRCHFHQLPGVDLSIVAKAGAGELNAADFSRELLPLFSRIADREPRS